MENESGALSRVSGLFSARGYNIESLTVAPTEDPTLSRMTIVTSGSDPVIEQIIKQLSENQADVAFFPYGRLAEIASLLGEKTGIYLNHKVDNVAIICKNMPEETGFDISLFRDIRFAEPSIIEKPSFSLSLDSSEHVLIGAWVNLSGSLK